MVHWKAADRGVELFQPDVGAENRLVGSVHAVSGGFFRVAELVELKFFRLNHTITLLDRKNKKGEVKMVDPGHPLLFARLF